MPASRLALSWLLALTLQGCGRAGAPASQEEKPQAEKEASALTAAVEPQPPLPVGLALAVPLSFSSEITSPHAVNSGVPFARGTVTSLEHLRLEDAAGNGIPAQFASLAKWPDGSYKAVLVTTLIDPRAASKTYVLRSGPEIAPAAVANPLSISESPDAITVTTGPMRFQVGKSPFRLFDQAWVDADQNGAFEESESVLQGPGDIFLIDKATGVEYRASRFTKPQVVIEEQGPLKAVLLAKGKLQGEKGDTLTDTIIRLTAYAGTDTVAVDYTLVDTREEKNVTARRERPALEVKGYGIELPLNLSAGATGLFGGERMQDVVAFGGPMGKTQHLFQGGRFNYVYGQLKPFEFWYEGVGSGERADGWVDASDSRLGITAMIRKFWQQFPKELAIEDGKLMLYLHPPRGTSGETEFKAPGSSDQGRYERSRAFYFPREGGAKTVQLLFSFHRGQSNPRDIRDRYETFDVNPRLIPSPEWFCQSGVFGDLVAYGPGSDEHDASLMRNVYARSVEAGQRYGSLAQLFGWRDYGDRLRPGWETEWEGGVKVPSFYNDTHVGAHNYFLQYLRTQDERWFDFAEIATRHWMDIDVSHTKRFGYYKKSYGPGEGHMINHSMIDHDARNQHKGHAHLSGTQELYLLTGDRRALEVLREYSDWWVNAVPDMYPVPIEKPHYAEAERDFAWPLFVLNEAYRVTGDAKYLKSAAHIVKHLIQWWQTPSEHLVGGKPIGRNDWRQGTGWWAMYPKCDNCPEGFNGTNPWMAGALISAVIQFKELNRDARLVDEELIQEMLLQTTNYMVKYGWRPQNYFIYSEGSGDQGGVINHSLFPVAYMALQYRKGVKHPERYDTAPQWEQIARSGYQSWQDRQSKESTDMGFYGYEVVYPMDYFSVMQQLGQPAEAPAS